MDIVDKNNSEIIRLIRLETEKHDTIFTVVKQTRQTKTSAIFHKAS